jgi:class 3 adenylate cyclase
VGDVRVNARGVRGWSDKQSGTRPGRGNRSHMSAAVVDDGRAARLPTGTVTFLFTDVEGSTSAWIQNSNGMRAAMARHDELIESLVGKFGGQVVRPRGEGDSRFAVFVRATDGIASACAIQLALLVEPWPLDTPLRVRMALHTGEADLRLGDYYGPAVNHCARLRAVAHAGQVLISSVTADLVREGLGAEVSLRDLGKHQLRDLNDSEHVWQLVHPSLPIEFPPLSSLTPKRHNLPVQLSTFVGREREVDALVTLLATARLVTMTGPGGIGKTRLALRTAAEAVEDFEDGVWLVELAPLADPRLVPQAVAASLRIEERPHEPLTAALTRHLQSRSLLLILDNCEHVIQSCAVGGSTTSCVPRFAHCVYEPRGARDRW